MLRMTKYPPFRLNTWNRPRISWGLHVICIAVWIFFFFLNHCYLEYLCLGVAHLYPDKYKNPYWGQRVYSKVFLRNLLGDGGYAFNVWREMRWKGITFLTWTCMLSHFGDVQFFATLWDQSPPGSSFHVIIQARILRWAAMPSSRGSSWPRDRITSLMSPALASRFFTSSVT